MCITLESLSLLNDIDASAISWSGGCLDIFGLGTNKKALYHKWWNGAWGPSLSDWENLRGTFSSEPTAVSWGANHIHLLGTDNEIFHKRWDDVPQGMGWKLLEQKGGAWGVSNSHQVQLLAAAIDSTFLVSEQTTHLFTNGGMEVDVVITYGMVRYRWYPH
ncbi:uncharacterized protein PADG_11726 [Paracoccidioides brasiliensis Pb18]|uniref:Uncharacterized protein n=1 Tax=Paracoccidioides brasiliensis (strain Pb18) TaxID=502780 RepID=A0A0A0HV28_PARBD|nr:uncharacterized protein PADG_11726 [Paracoccidioides brasiliensis Pb18]KGM92188.1 hypothetical protein PADG_11726 [Paracoccidioides brasiliensis Pb18]